MNGLDAEALVVGGGLAGLAAAIAVAQAGLATVHAAPAAPPDRRTSALMMPSVAFLGEKGLIGDPAELGHPLTRIRIIDATARLIRAPETLFDAREAGLDAFGWNFANTALAARFAAVADGLATLERRETTLESAEIGEDAITVRLGDGTTLRVGLLVGADGKRSTVRAAAGFAVREHPYEQAALVCDLDLGRPLDGTSVEFHYPQGPFTLVPAGGNRANLVWIDARPVLEEARGLDPAALAQRLGEKSQHLFGATTPVTPPVVFPLASLSVSPAGGRGVVLVGEAAHAFPPIGAQGLNLGLRDVADLAAALTETDRSRPGWAEAASADYASRRAGDLARTGGMVDALFRSLLAEHLPAQALRAAGLWGLRALPGLRRRAFALGMGAQG